MISIGDRKPLILGIDKDSIFGAKSHRDFVHALKRPLIDTHSYAGDATLTALADRMKKERTIMVENTLESSAIEQFFD